MASSREGLLEMGVAPGGPNVLPARFGQNVSERVFQPAFMSYVQTKLNAFVTIRHHDEVAAPIVAYLHDLVMKPDNTGMKGEQVAERSFVGLLALFDEKAKAFSGPSATAREQKQALKSLRDEVKDHVYATQKQYVEVIKGDAEKAQALISSAKTIQRKDIALISICALWFPIENLITVLNCFGTACAENPQPPACSRECANLPRVTGRYHLFAPGGSLVNLCQEYDEQAAIIQQAAPSLQVMR